MASPRPWRGQLDVGYRNPSYPNPASDCADRDIPDFRALESYIVPDFLSGPFVPPKSQGSLPKLLRRPGPLLSCRVQSLRLIPLQPVQKRPWKREEIW